MRRKNETSFRILSGAEIETLADYWGQGAVGVKYYYGPTEKDAIFHPIPKAYDNTIASVNELSLTTDSNRSEERHGFPMRTCIEFRSGPGSHMTEELLHVLKSYSNWVIIHKKLLRETEYENYSEPKRRELRPHDVPLSIFINYYNQLPTTKNQLALTSPSVEFRASNATHGFFYDFPETAEWVIRFEHADLDPRYLPVFFAQYNLSIPIGYVFDPEIRHLFPLQKNFPLLHQEKEIAADFNESRPHHDLRKYEENLFLSCIALADQFFAQVNAPLCALGMRDFLRGMAFEIALISTSQKQLYKLFRNEAVWIWQNQNPGLQGPQEKELDPIENHLSSTLYKSLFPYFMKTTLSHFFKYLHPYEQHLLREIPKENLKHFFSSAVRLSNDKQMKGNEQPYLTLDTQCMLEKFDAFYQETFLRKQPGEYPTDPIAWLTERLIDPVNLSLTNSPVYAVVLEVRQPEQGNQRFEGIKKLCENYTKQLNILLNKAIPVLIKTRQTLDELQPVKKVKTPSISTSMSHTFIQNKNTPEKSSLKKKRKIKESGDNHTKRYHKFDLWTPAKSYRADTISLCSGNKRRKLGI